MMKSFYAVLSALVSLAVAQSLSDIPACAAPCLGEAFKAVPKCASMDFGCICDNQDALVGTATGCVLLNCGAKVATDKVLPACLTFCKQVKAGGTVSGTLSAFSTGAATSTSGGADATGVVVAATTTTGSSNSSTTTKPTAVAATGAASLATCPLGFALLALGAVFVL